MGTSQLGGKCAYRGRLGKDRSSALKPAFLSEREASPAIAQPNADRNALVAIRWLNPHRPVAEVVVNDRRSVDA